MILDEPTANLDPEGAADIGEIIRGIRMQNPPATGGVAAMDDLAPPGRLFKFGDQFLIGSRAEVNRAGVNFADAKKFIEQFRAAAAAHVAVSQH